MKVMFRSDDKNSGDGFKARWEQNCGGILEADETARTLSSPGYPEVYGRQMYCNYTFVARKQYINIKFLDFELENCKYDEIIYYVILNCVCIVLAQRGCIFDNVTIHESNAYSHWIYGGDIISEVVPESKAIGSYCGSTIPGPFRMFDSVSLVFQTDKWIQRRGFKLHYFVDSMYYHLFYKHYIYGIV